MDCIEVEICREEQEEELRLCNEKKKVSGRERIIDEDIEEMIERMRSNIESKKEESSNNVYLSCAEVLITRLPVFERIAQTFGVDRVAELISKGSLYIS